MKLPPLLNRGLTAWYLRRHRVEWSGELPVMDMLRKPLLLNYGRLILGSGVRFLHDLGPIKIQVDQDATVTIGSNSVLNGPIWIRAADEVTIGEDALIAPWTMIFDHNLHPVFYNDEKVIQPVRLGQNVWIMAHCFISPGTQIGDGSAVGWNSRTKGTYKSNTLIAGNPARVIEIDHRHPKPWVREKRKH